jgi:carbon-monoxide dehydrogenase small subunit
MKIRFVLNGESVSVESSMTRRLLDVIRSDFDLTGTKEGCSEGECGACLVYLDKELVNACLIPMGNVVGREVLTIEGLSNSEEYKRIEKAFIDEGGVQCGYCTPGFVMSTNELIKTNKDLNEDEIKDGLSGNLCRCTGYQSIVEAVKKLSGEGSNNG